MSFKSIMAHMCQAGGGGQLSEEIFRAVELGSLDGATGAPAAGALGWHWHVQRHLTAPPNFCQAWC
jgi:hypothetical protein